MPWEVIKGNTSVQDIPIYDKDGALVTNLATATEIKFHVKETETESESPDIEKTKGDGIQVDTPSLGYLRITIAPADTSSLEEKDYYMALQIKWSATVLYETKLFIENRREKIFRLDRGMVT